MKLWWIDLETTGLDPRRDQILEIAVAEADLMAPFDARHLYHAVLYYPPAAALALDPFVLEMHTKNGLLAECSRSTKVARDIGEDLWSAFVTLDDVPEFPALAGSAVHFDHEFLKRIMPVIAARFSHRHYDVSAVKLFARSLGMPKLPKAEAHRAKADIDESIAHARACADWFDRNRT